MKFARMLPDELPLTPITQAALDCFAVNGYHGTTIRQIANAAGLSVPGVYHHFESKHAILVDLCEVAMTQLLDASHRALDAAGGSVVDRFDALVECLVQFHTDFADVALVSFSEIRALQGKAREQHLEHRRQEQQLITDVVEDGVAAEVFATDDPRHVARAIASICLGMSQWYRPNQGLTVDELAAAHVRICRDTARLVDKKWLPRAATFREGSNATLERQDVGFL